MSRTPFQDSDSMHGRPAEGSHDVQDDGDVRGALSPTVRAELDRRLEAHRLNHDAAEPREVVEAEVLAYLDQGLGDVAEWPLTDAQKAELDRRLEEIDRDPDGAGDVDWEDLREDLLRRVALRRASAA